MLLFVEIPDQAEKPPIKAAMHTILHKLDLIGFVLFAPAAIQLLLALEYGGSEYPWGSATVIGLFCGAAGTFALFLYWEYRQGDRAMIPLSMIAKRTVWSSCLVMLCLFAMVLCASYYLPVYFQAIKNASPMMSGVYILPSILSQLVFAVTSGALSKIFPQIIAKYSALTVNLVGKFGYYLPWAVFCGIATAIGGGLISTFTPSTPVGKWVGYQIILGVGRGAGFQTVSSFQTMERG